MLIFEFWGLLPKNYNHYMSRLLSLTLLPMASFLMAEHVNMSEPGSHVPQKANSGLRIQSITNTCFKNRVQSVDPESNQSEPYSGKHKERSSLGDLNTDGLVDIQDMGIIITKWRTSGIDLPDADLDKDGNINVLDLIGLMNIIGIITPPVDLSIENFNNDPTRICQGPSNHFFITNSITDSLFIYDSMLNPKGEFKDLDKPLGVAVDQFGNIFIGNNGRDNIEVFGSDFTHIRTITGIQMPNDLQLDNSGNLYVADSIGNVVKVFDSTGNWLRNIGSPGSGDGELDFPVAMAILYNQDMDILYIADQGHAKVTSYNLEDGSFLASFGGKIEAFSSDWEGKFTKIQSLALDANGRLHALDCYLNKVQILDPDPWLEPDSERFIEAYGTFGLEVGNLNIPLDIFINGTGQVMVTNTGNHRVEVLFQTIPKTRSGVQVD